MTERQKPNSARPVISPEASLKVIERMNTLVYARLNHRQNRAQPVTIFKEHQPLLTAPENPALTSDFRDMIAGKASDKPIDETLAKLLTPREQRLLSYIQKGHSLQDAALELGIPESIVNNVWLSLQGQLTLLARRIGALDKKAPPIGLNSLVLRDGNSTPIISEPPPNNQANLTDLQQRIAELLTEGRTAEEISKILGLSIKSAKAQITRTKRKLGLESEAKPAKPTTLTPYKKRKGIFHLLKERTILTDEERQSLTKTERRVIDLILEGTPRGELAKKMQVTPFAINTYLSNIKKKLSLDSK